MATLHFFCGKAGAGKSTLARELGATLPGLVICEDEWIAALGFPVRSVDDYRDVSSRCRKIMETIVPAMLRLGVPVVLDYAANTVERRAWIRSLFESAGADHVLHVIEADDSECLANIHRRNEEKPVGVYWGPVSDELFFAITPYFVPPTEAEGFNISPRITYSRQR